VSEAVLEMRAARREDAAEIWELVRATGVLDVNSPYCYLLACEELGETCVVAREGERLAGFVVALRPPRRPDTIFVWQVAVDGSQRGRGLGRRLLRELVALPGCEGVRWLEATVTPSNHASRALFRAFARERGAECRVGEHYAASDFPGDDHEAEDLFRIGPLDAGSASDPGDPA
jgi:L-2,4-diaminobutyric acid acetyltransferase